MESAIAEARQSLPKYPSFEENRIAMAVILGEAHILQAY
jgi:hypothetical protein